MKNALYPVASRVFEATAELLTEIPRSLSNVSDLESSRPPMENQLNLLNALSRATNKFVKFKGLNNASN